MLSRRWLIQTLGFLTLTTLVVGCGNKGGVYATVSGVITHNGTPVEGAQIIFHPTVEVDGKKQQSYAALTDSSGKYVIASVGKEPGFPPGLYKITIAKQQGKGAAAAELDAGQLDAMTSDTGPTGKSGPVHLLPREYATLGSSKLSATLQEGKNENVNFDLKGKAG